MVNPYFAFLCYVSASMTALAAGCMAGWMVTESVEALLGSADE